MEKEYNAQRADLISKLRQKGIKDEAVLEAMGRVPREKFIARSLWDRAYEDNALPIDCRQTISQPYTVACMTMLLNVADGCKVLEIGTGSGYQAAILSEMGAEVYTIERIEELYDRTKDLLLELGFHVFCFHGDGTLGLREFAPWDRIIVTAAAPKEPPSLVAQLAKGGRMVIPIGKEDYQSMCVFEKSTTGDVTRFSTDDFRFVPLIGKEGWQY